MDQLKKLFESFLADGAAMAREIIELRRHLHQHPEIGHQELVTTGLLRTEMEKLNLTIYDKDLVTGFWADLDTGRPGPTIAVRSDIDALQVEEKTNLPFASKETGKMHACGHDVHMAIMIGAARLLAKHRDQLKGRIRFIAQPAEEVPPGGAEILIKAGVLKSPQVDAIVALHVDPSLPTGSLGMRDGINMAATYDFDMTVIGQSGHAAKPHEAVDAITVAAQIITGLQQVITRMVDPVNPALLTFGTIAGGTARNVVADKVLLRGTLRTLDAKLVRQLPRQIKKTAIDIARAFGANVKIIPVGDFPGLEADPKVNEIIFQAYKDLFPTGKTYRIPVILGGEDFSRYLQTTPGSMFRLGVGNKKIGADKPWHHSQFIVDEDAIPIGFITMAATVVRMLNAYKTKDKVESKDGKPGGRPSRRKPTGRPRRSRPHRSRPRPQPKKSDSNQ